MSNACQACGRTLYGRDMEMLLVHGAYRNVQIMRPQRIVMVNHGSPMLNTGTPTTNSYILWRPYDYLRHTAQYVGLSSGTMRADRNI
jgi:hypothetical protein